MTGRAALVSDPHPFLEYDDTLMVKWHMAQLGVTSFSSEYSCKYAEGDDILTGTRARLLRARTYLHIHKNTTRGDDGINARATTQCREESPDMLTIDTPTARQMTEASW